METLLYVVLWAAAIFLMMRFGCGAHMMGHGHRHEHGSQKNGQQPTDELRWVDPKKAPTRSAARPSRRAEPNPVSTPATFTTSARTNVVRSSRPRRIDTLAEMTPVPEN